MRKNLIPLYSIQPPAASTTAIIDLPVGVGGANGRGLRLHRIILQHGYASGTNTVAAACTNITEIQLVANGGKVLRRLTGTELRDLVLKHGTQYDFTGVPNTAPGVALEINFSEPWRQQPDRDAGALVTAWQSPNGAGATALSKLQLLVTLGAASTPTLAAHAEWDSVLPKEQPPFLFIERQDISVQGTAHEAVILGGGVISEIAAYADSGGSNQASKVFVRVGQDTIVEVTSSALAKSLAGAGMYPTASGRTAKISDIVFDADDFLGSGLDLRGILQAQLRLEAASAMSGTVRALISRFLAI